MRPRTHRNGSGAGHRAAPAGTAVLERPVAAEAAAEAEESEPEPPPVRVQHAAPCWCCSAPISALPRTWRARSPTTPTRAASTPPSRPLDEYVNRLPTEGVVVIVTASYNGNPPDNAARFWTGCSDTSLPPDALQGVKYTVFGCGNREWASTYQKVPTTIDQALAAHGAERVYTHGEGDVADDFDDQFRTWSGPLWPAWPRRSPSSSAPDGGGDCRWSPLHRRTREHRRPTPSWPPAVFNRLPSAPTASCRRSASDALDAPHRGRAA